MKNCLRSCISIYLFLQMNSLNVVLESVLVCVQCMGALVDVCALKVVQVHTRAEEQGKKKS